MRLASPLNQDFRLGLPAAIDYTSNRLRWSRFFHPFHPERLRQPGKGLALPPPGTENPEVTHFKRFLEERRFQFAIRRARRTMRDQLPGLQAEAKVLRSVSPPLLGQIHGGRLVECALQFDCPELFEIPGTGCGPPTTPD